MYNRSVNTRLRLMDRNGHALSQFLRRGGELTDAVILALYGNGENGGVYCPYDLTDEKLAWVAANPSFTSAQFMAEFPQHTLFQDHVGTIPVTGHLQPIGKVLDKSGRNNHASQPLSAARPLWQDPNWQYFDGVDDRLESLPSNALTIPFTMAARFIPDEVATDDSGRYRVVSRGNGASTRGAISINNSQIHINLDGASGINVTPVAIGDDVTVVCRFLANGTQVVVNGQEFSFSNFISLPANEAPIHIGSQTTSTNVTQRYFKGKIGNVVLINEDIGADSALSLNNFMRTR